jgi:hypothetical protein
MNTSYSFHEYLLPAEGHEAEVLREGVADEQEDVTADDPRVTIDGQLKQLLDETRDFMDWYVS